jgi:hypothetical protein
MFVLPLIFSLLLLGAILYLGGWVRPDVDALSAKIRRNSGVLIVFGATLLLTRNIGLAVLSAMVAYSLVSRAGRFFGAGPGEVPSPRSMSLEEAYRVLELNRGATREDVQNAYRNLMKRNHPDQGGSTYIASKLNEAKDILLKNLAV